MGEDFGHGHASGGFDRVDDGGLSTLYCCGFFDFAGAHCFFLE
jgi:hypothetical protein